MQKFLPSNNTYIFKCEDEVVPSQPELDYLLINADLQVYLCIGSFEAKIWKLLQAHKNTADIIAVLSIETGKFEQERVQSILNEWHTAGLIHVKDEHIHHKNRPLWQRLIWTEISISFLDEVLEKIYSFTGRYLTSWWGLAILSGIIFGGVIIGVRQLVAGQILLLTSPSVANILLLILIGLVCLSIHELGHAFALIWAKSKVLRVGVALYLGLPVFFVDTTAIWAKRRWKRVVTASAGMMMNALQAAIAVIAGALFTTPFLKALSWEIVIINLTMIAISIVPFIRMDGYYIMVDLIGVPKIDKKAFHELKDWAVHPRRYNYSREHLLLLGYGTMAVVFSGLTIAYSGWYWLRLLKLILGL